MSTDHNEAMRLADELDAPTVTHHQVSRDWEPYETAKRVVEKPAINKQAAALLRQLSAERDQLRAEVERLMADAERLDWLLWRIPNAIRHCVGELAVTSDGDKFRAAIDQARTTHKDEG